MPLLNESLFCGPGTPAT